MFNKLYENIKIFILENIKFLIALILILVIFTYEAPYVIYTPGGIVNLDERISIDSDVSKDGTLNMSYVTMRKGTLPNILFSFMIPNWDLLKSEDITRGDESIDELIDLEKIYMKTSTDNATILAYQKAGKSISIAKTHNYVSYIADFSKTDILMGDEIISVGGKDITSIIDLMNVVDSHDYEDLVEILVKRKNKEVKCTARVMQVNDEKKIGISLITTYDYIVEPELNIKIKDSESGSSGGLMLTLAIYNDLVSDDLTKGRKIVGTGTISLDGTVGAIDGVKYKMLGAEKNKADIFLCPEENYEEALKIKEKYNLKLTLKRVSTFDEAVMYLVNG